MGTKVRGGEGRGMLFLGSTAALKKRLVLGPSQRRLARERKTLRRKRKGIFTWTVMMENDALSETWCEGRERGEGHD